MLPGNRQIARADVTYLKFCACVLLAAYLISVLL